ncbi:zinc ribbon domain-containing protein [Proteiniclasticum sp.]|nr:hypothetical protein [Proteiniclasticum sp.]
MKKIRQDKAIYNCHCGFKTHRDILGAMNIITAPVTGGYRLSA